MDTSNIHKINRNSWVKLLFGLSTIAMYIVVFFIVVPRIGLGATSLGILPAMVFGALYGTRVGTIAGVLILPLNIVLGSILGQNWAILFEGMGTIGHLLIIAVGVFFFRIYDLNSKLKKELSQIRHLEQSEAQLAAIIQANQDAIILSDASGRILYFNQSFKNMTGKLLELPADADVLSFFPKKDSAALQESMRKAFEHGSSDYQSTIAPQTDKGAALPVAIHFSILGDKSQLSKNQLIITIRELSSLHRTRKQLEERNEELETLLKTMVGRELKMVEMKQTMQQEEEKHP